MELGGIATTAEMMGLVASRGEKLTGGPLSALFLFSDVTTPGDRLRYGLIFTVSVLAMPQPWAIISRSALRAVCVS